jgi:hypothetical protein
MRLDSSLTYEVASIEILHSVLQQGEKLLLIDSLQPSDDELRCCQILTTSKKL